MASLSQPDRISCDAFSDPNIKYGLNGGSFTSFTNQLQLPLLKVRGIQLIRASFVNPVLQLNDACQLMFFYYRGAAANTTVSAANLRCVRLYPSNFIPAAAYTAYTRNRYFNTVTELVSALNTAASTGGDNVTYNPKWIANDIIFSYDTNTRRVSVTGATVTNFYAPAAADDPNILAYLATNAITMNSYAGVITQPYVLNQSMNSRIGFAQSYYNRGTWWSGASIIGVATSTGVPYVNGSTIEADTFPILLGTQNINVYCTALGSTGQDSRNQKNLLATIPVEVGSLNINSYTLTSLEQPAHIVNAEIYNLTFSFQDDFGNAVIMPANYNINLELNIFYN